MPRVMRRGFSRTGLTQEQREWLLYGFSIGSKAPEFGSELDERAAWERYGEHIKTERWGAGQRPYAFFRWDLRISFVPLEWWKQLGILLDRKLISAEEKFAIEARYPVLDPEQSPDFNRTFEHGDVSGTHLGSYVLTRLSEEFAFASRWHDDRGRAQLAAKYGRCADNTRAHTRLG